MQTIIRLPPTHGLDPATQVLDGRVVTEGSPKMNAWVLHTAAAGDVASGIWECIWGSCHATCSACEYVVLIAGRIAITPDGGQPVTVRAGASFVVEPTFKGTWRIEEDVRKNLDFCFKRMTYAVWARLLSDSKPLILPSPPQRPMFGSRQTPSEHSGQCQTANRKDMTCCLLCQT